MTKFVLSKIKSSFLEMLFLKKSDAFSDLMGDLTPKNLTNDSRTRYGGSMGRGQRYTSEQIILKLREAEVLQSQGHTQSQICKQLNVAQDTYVRWRKEYGGMRVDQAKKLKDLEKENQQLKKLVADLSLDNSMLKEVNKGNF